MSLNVDVMSFETSLDVGSAGMKGLDELEDEFEVTRNACWCRRRGSELSSDGGDGGFEKIDKVSSLTQMEVEARSS
jgi:hypothetical protein